jgi:hypothetical protein
MKKRLISWFVVVFTVGLVVSLGAQPITGGGGLTRVTHDSSLSGSGTTTNPLAVVTTVMQSRVTGTCTTPNAIDVVNADGTVTCSSGVLNTSNVSGTSGFTTKFTGTNTIGNAWPQDDGSAWGSSGKFTITESNGDVHTFGAATVDGLATLTGGFTLGADSSAASHKITSLTDGSSAQDAAAFGQIATGINAAVSGTNNTTTKFTGTHTIGNAWPLDDATSWGVSGKFLITEASGNTVVSGTLDATGNFNVNTNKFSVVASSGNTTVAGTLGVTSDLAVNTNKFNVTASSGNTTVAGTLGVTGNLAVNTNKFTVTAASGNTLVAGTLDSTGNFAVNTSNFTVAASTGNTVVAGTLSVTSDVAVNTNKFTVTASSGNTLVAGTFTVNGNTTLGDTPASDTTTVNGFTTIANNNATADTLELYNTNTGGYGSVAFYDNTPAIKGASGYGNSLATDATVRSRLYWRTLGSDMIFTTGSGTPSTAAIFLTNSTGNVNIGSTASDPGFKLRVQGTFDSTGNSQIDGNTTLGDATSDTTAINGATTITGPTSAVGLVVKTTAQANIRINGDTDNTSDNSYTGYIIAKGSTPTELWYIGRDGTGNTDGLIIRRAATTDDLKIDTSGNATYAGNWSVNGNTTLGDAAGDTVTINGAATINNNVLNLNSHRITNVTDPSGAQDASTKNYVDTKVGLFIGRQVLTAASGTYTPTSGTKRVRVRMVGGGGGGGGASGSSGDLAAGGGGASGAYFEKFIDPGATVTGGAFANGAAGSAGSSSAGNGGNGGDTTIVVNSTTYTAKGGTGGTGMAHSSVTAAAAGGVGQAGSSAGDVLYQQDGQGGWVIAATLFYCGIGGSSALGAGGMGGGVAVARAGIAGTGNGAGGGGACAGNSSLAGAAGTIGIIIVEEFI